MTDANVILLWMASLARENALQAEIIRLQKQLEEVRPSMPGKDAHWHQVSGGKTAEETLDSNDLEAVKALNKWTRTFAEKYLKPYLHHEVYMETLAHINRGISAKLAVLEVESDLQKPAPAHSHQLKLLDFFQALSTDPQPESSKPPPDDFENVDF